MLHVCSSPDPSVVQQDEPFLPQDLQPHEAGLENVAEICTLCPDTSLRSANLRLRNP